MFKVKYSSRQLVLILAIFVPSFMVQINQTQAIDLREVARNQNQTELQLLQANSSQNVSHDSKKLNKNQRSKRTKLSSLQKHDKNFTQGQQSKLDPDQTMIQITDGDKDKDKDSTDENDWISPEDQNEGDKTNTSPFFPQKKALKPLTNADVKQSSAEDPRLSTDPTFMHLEKFKNLGVACYDMMSDKVISIKKSIIGQEEDSDKNDKNDKNQKEGDSDKNQKEGDSNKNNKKQGLIKKKYQLSQFSMKGMQYYQMTNGELFWMIFLILFLICCVPCIICICCVVCMQTQTSA